MKCSEWSSGGAREFFGLPIIEKLQSEEDDELLVYVKMESQVYKTSHTALMKRTDKQRLYTSMNQSQSCRNLHLPVLTMGRGLLDQDRF
jgi:hypothetical protein